MFLNTVTSNVFGSGDAKLEGALKNPNQYKQAVIFEALSNLPAKKMKEFVRSKEAQTMVTEGIISQDDLDRLESKPTEFCRNTAVCAKAKEAEDPLWNQLVELRIQERRVMNALIEKYGKSVSTIANNADTDIVEQYIPRYFRED